MQFNFSPGGEVHKAVEKCCPKASDDFIRGLVQ